MRKILLITILILTCTKLVFAAACTSSADGDWNDSSKWSSCGGGVPGNGDTVTISHNIDVNVDTTIGTSPGWNSGTAAILTTGGSVTVSEDVTLTLRGDVYLGEQTWTMEPGSTLTFDASQASSPSNTNYFFLLGYANNPTTQPTLDINGTEAKPVTINSDLTNSANPGIITSSTYTSSGVVQVEWAVFEDIGANNGYGTYASIELRGIGDSGETTYIRDSQFVRCNEIDFIENIAASHNFDMQRTLFYDSVGTYSLDIDTNAAISGGTRTLDENEFDKEVNFADEEDWTITGNYFLGGYTMPGSTYAEFTLNSESKHWLMVVE